MVGGCLEYLSLVTGYRLLLVVAALLYLAAVVLGGRQVRQRTPAPRLPVPEVSPSA